MLRGTRRRPQAAFNDAFWRPDKGWYAVGLDRDKRPIDALASNMGHCPSTGIVDADKAGRITRPCLHNAQVCFRDLFKRCGGG